MSAGPMTGFNTIRAYQGWGKIRKSYHLSTGDEIFTITEVFTDSKNYRNIHALRIILNLLIYFFGNQVYTSILTLKTPSHDLHCKLNLPQGQATSQVLQDI